MKTILRISKYVLISIYALCGIMLLVFLVPRTGWKALNVATGSMSPAIPAGSLVVIHHTDIRQLRVGQVVTYINPYNTKETITHRIVVVTKAGQIPAFITKGDANKTPDRQILGGNVVGTVVYHAPHVGRVLAWTRRPVGLILLVIIPGLLIIIDEIRRMVQALSSSDSIRGSKKELPVDPRVKHEDDKLGTVAPIQPAPPAAVVRTKPVAKRGPRMDGLVKSVALIALVITIATGATRASLTSSASLTGNTISTTVAAANHLLIERVFIGGSGSGGAVCPLVNSTASIVDANGVNTIIITTNCHVTINSNTTVTVTNSNNQSSSSGSAESSGNTNGGSATTGDSSNSNSTSTTVTIGNAGQQWVELFNPTSVAISVGGWTLHDDSTTASTLPTRTIAPGHALFIRASLFGGQIAGGLNGAGDHLILDDNLGALVDELSWGTDVSIMNPSVAAIPVGAAAQRINPIADTDTAADWQVVGP